MREELEKIEQLNMMDANYFAFDFKDFKPEWMIFIIESVEPQRFLWGSSVIRVFAADEKLKSLRCSDIPNREQQKGIIVQKKDVLYRT